MNNEIFLLLSLLGEKFEITSHEFESLIKNNKTVVFYQPVHGGFTNIVMAFENKPYCIITKLDYWLDKEEINKAELSGISCIFMK